MNIKKDFGLRLKEIRTKKGITQYCLAEMVGIDPKHLSHIGTSTQMFSLKQFLIINS